MIALDRRERRDDLGKIPAQRLTVLRDDRDVVAVAVNERAKAVPFRLVLPVPSDRNRIDRTHLHRREVRVCAAKAGPGCSHELILPTPLELVVRCHPELVEGPPQSMSLSDAPSTSSG